MIDALLGHLWQSTLVALVAGLCTLALRSNAARVRYWVWFAASVKFLIPFHVLTWLGSRLPWRSALAPATPPTVFEHVVQPVSTLLSAATLTLSATGTDLGLSIATILVSIWALGCLAVLARWVVNWSRLRTLVRNATPAPISAPIPVRFTQTTFEPGVVGILRPVLILPHGITDRLNAAQLQAVLAHEFCHVRRADNLTAAVHMVLEAIFWFHPLIWWISGRLVEERERACDEYVLALGNDKQAYAESILKVCQFYLESKLACAAGVSGASLKKRVEVIMKNRLKEPLNVAKRLSLGAVTAVVLAVPIGVGMLRSPAALAQTPTAEATLTFDSVVISRSQDSPYHRMMITTDRFTTVGTALRMVIADAYGVDRSRVVGGPAWIDQGLYDISARVAGTAADRPGIPSHPGLKTLLASRFQLVAHAETQQIAAYALRLAPGGSKLNEAIKDDQQAKRTMMTIRPTLWMAQSTNVAALAAPLASFLGKPVVDETGLKGLYDFALNGSLNADTLPAALRDQLGLTLEPTTTNVDLIVIDSVQPPTLDAPSQPAA